MAAFCEFDEATAIAGEGEGIVVVVFC